MIELLVTLLIIVILVIVAYFTYISMKESIDNKLPLDTFKKSLDDIVSVDNQLNKKQDDFTKQLTTFNTDIESKFLTVNSNIENVVSTDKVIQTSINTLQGTITKDKTYQTNQNNYANNWIATLYQRDNDITTKIKPLIDNAAPYLMKDLASVDSSVLNIAPTTNIKEVNINKPINISKNTLTMDNWVITSDNDKLCFNKNQKKVLCISQNDTPLELYDTNGELTNNKNRKISDIPLEFTNTNKNSKINDIPLEFTNTNKKNNIIDVSTFIRGPH
jgi:hypothetical protein